MPMRMLAVAQNIEKGSPPEGEPTGWRREDPQTRRNAIALIILTIAQRTAHSSHRLYQETRPGFLVRGAVRSRGGGGCPERYGKLPSKPMSTRSMAWLGELPIVVDASNGV